MVESYDYSLEYNLFLAEQEYYNGIQKILDEMMLSDEITYDYVNEAFSDTVATYIDKVTRGIQKAWNKFKTSVNFDKDKKYLVKIRSSIAQYNGSDWYIKNYPDYDPKIVPTIRIIPLDYVGMKDSLEKKEEFLQNYYRNLKFDTNKPINVKKIVTDTVIKNTIPRMDVTKEFLVDKFNFCAKDYSKYMDSVEEDIKAMNTIISGIINLSATISANESVNFKTVYESMIFEAPTNPLNKQKKESMSFANSDGTKLKTAKNNEQNMFMKRISLYMSVMTDIISAKMTILQKMYKDYMKILTTAYKQSGKATVSLNGENGKNKAKTQVDL